MLGLFVVIGFGGAFSLFSPAIPIIGDRITAQMIMKIQMAFRLVWDFINIIFRDLL
jgi:hypothetical protein